MTDGKFDDPVTEFVYGVYERLVAGRYIPIIQKVPVLLRRRDDSVKVPRCAAFKEKAIVHYPEYATTPGQAVERYRSRLTSCVADMERQIENIKKQLAATTPGDWDHKQAIEEVPSK